jgi:two-component system NtrC family sensor kinase
VAARWRIRHKLVLGLCLVVLIMALLLGGTLRGLWSYYVTMNGIRSNMAGLKEAEELKEAIARLVEPLSLSFLERHPAQVKTRTRDVRVQLEEYRRQLTADLAQQGEPEALSAEAGFIQDIAKNLDLLERVILEEAGRPRMLGPGDERPGAKPATTAPPDYSTLELPPATASGLVATLATPATCAPLRAAVAAAAGSRVVDPVRNLTILARDLRNSIYDHLDKHLGESRRHYQTSLWIIVPASIVGLLSMAGLMRSFYAWIFTPIRDLEAGVNRVGGGDFEHRIELHSGDEMEDLAGAFNAMTQRLKDLYGDLARQVNERSRQLVRSERLASVGFLAAGVAHEINNPLHSIALCSEALESRLLDLMRQLPPTPRNAEDLAVITKYLKMIQDESFRCKKITERLLEFSRTGERKREPADLAQLIQAVVGVTQHLPNSRGKEIVLEANTDRVPGGRIKAPINAEEIKSVVLNLVINALDSMDEGGRLTIRLSQRDGMAEIQFSDTGCGMTQEVLENIFEPFFTRNRTGKGTGLGLTISHRIIHQHGGEIEASSPGPNRGSTFIVRLPLRIDETAPTLPGPGSEGRPLGLAA